jgi:hypothetical protein
MKSGHLYSTCIDVGARIAAPLGYSIVGLFTSGQSKEFPHELFKVGLVGVGEVVVKQVSSMDAGAASMTRQLVFCPSRFLQPWQPQRKGRNSLQLIHHGRNYHQTRNGQGRSS